MIPRPPNLEPKWPPRFQTWDQDGPLDFQFGTKMAPKTPNLEPRWPQDPQPGAKVAPDLPTWSQDRLKKALLATEMAS